MPNYDYHCEANGTTVEIAHPMGDSISTWGELCERAGIGTGRTPASTPVSKVVPLVAAGGSKPQRPEGPCGSACGCFPQ